MRDGERGSPRTESGATAAAAPGARLVSRLVGRVVDARGGEVVGVAWAFAYFFTLLCGYYILRPLREEMAIRGGVERLHWLFTATFLAMLGGVPLFSALMARVPRARAIPLVYRFFLLNLVAFWALLRLGIAPAAVARAFFVWVSVYNLFVVSVFWGFMADLFTSEQGRRLFGFVAAGGSAGALVGPALAASLVGLLGVSGLVLASALLLEASARCASRLARWARHGGTAPALAARGEAPVGGTAWSGIRVVFRSPFLLGIAGQTLLFAVTSTFLYFQQARIVASALHDTASRTRLFAAVDLAVNVGTLATQTLATGRLLTAAGVGAGLALVPLLSGAGFAVLAAAPSLWVLGAFQAVRRAAHYAVERPSREVLFTVVGREEKYKSKSFVDTVVYRGGDALSGWAYSVLSAAGLSLAGSALAALPLAAASVALAVWLGRRHHRMERP